MLCLFSVKWGRAVEDLATADFLRHVVAWPGSPGWQSFSTFRSASLSHLRAPSRSPVASPSTPCGPGTPALPVTHRLGTTCAAALYLGGGRFAYNADPARLPVGPGMYVLGCGGGRAGAPPPGRIARGAVGSPTLIPTDWHPGKTETATPTEGRSGRLAFPLRRSVVQ